MRVAAVVAIGIPLIEGRLSWARTDCGVGDIPTRWASEVDPDSVLPLYPRPQMVRLLQKRNRTFSWLRDHGDEDSWINLNGIWEWEPAQESAPTPARRPLRSAILVPFPPDLSSPPPPQPPDPPRSRQRYFRKKIKMRGIHRKRKTWRQE